MRACSGLSAEELLNYFQSLLRNLEIDCKILMNIDSTNMQPEHWKEIANAVFNHYDDYDGFVITWNGYVSLYIFCVILYAARFKKTSCFNRFYKYLLVLKRQTQRKNVADALRFACENVGGVFIVFDSRVIIGTRAVKNANKKL